MSTAKCDSVFCTPFLFLLHFGYHQLSCVLSPSNRAAARLHENDVMHLAWKTVPPLSIVARRSIWFHLPDYIPMLGLLQVSCVSGCVILFQAKLTVQSCPTFLNLSIMMSSGECRLSVDVFDCVPIK